MEMSNKLDALRINDVREEGEDDYEALDKFIQWISQLALMARAENRDDEAKVRLLTKAVTATEWGVNVQQRIPAEPSFQTLINASYISMSELGTFHAKSSVEPSVQAGGFRKTLCKERRNELSSDTFMAEFIEAFFIGPRRWVMIRGIRNAQRIDSIINNIEEHASTVRR